MTLSPRALLALLASLSLLVLALATALALRGPALPAGFGAGPEGELQVLAADAGSGLSAGDIVVALHAGGERVPVDGSLAIEEPDNFPTYEAYNAFMALQTQLAAAADGASLEAELADGSRVALAAGERGLADLPALFWLQVLFGVAGMLTGALVLAGRPGQQAARLYALTGLGFLIFAPAAAVYSTRELLLDGDIFRAMSVANHFGALLFTGALTALVWSYPVRAGRLPVVSLVLAASLLAFALDTLQVGGEMTLYHLSVLVIFALSFVFAGMQWYRTRGKPAERAALRWFLLSIYIATGLFAGVVIIPAALGVTPPASQGVMFGAFLIMYWGLALGVVRYRLFQLEGWWRSIVWWFLGGVAVVVVDILLVSMLSLSDAMALSLAVAVVGWLYFPLRQLTWQRLARRRERALEDWLPDVLPLLINVRAGASQEAQIRDNWPAALEAVYRPLLVEPGDSRAREAAIVEDGLALVVPDLHRDARTLVLRNAAQGERLFTREDLATLKALQELFGLALDRLRERDAGARVERERIRRDVHDDIGAKLLSLLHSTPPDRQAVVREALDDLRMLLRALEQESVRLDDAVDGWQAEARKRCEGAGVALNWRGELGDFGARELSSRQAANLTRIVREAISNALRHAAPSRLDVEVHCAPDQLQVLLRNNGQVRPLHEWQSGRGRQIMLGRAGELDAQIDWRVDGGDCEVSLRVPLAPA